MESLKIAIVDDLQADRNQLRESLHRCAKDLSLLLQTVEFESGELFLDALQTSCFDVVFLDIVMNGLDGMEVAAAIRQQNKDCLVVFVTTSKEYAVQSYRVRAFDYLVKPFGYQQLLEVLTLCDAALQKRCHYIEIKESRTWVKIPLRDIIYADYSNHYIQLHTDKRMVRSYMYFAELAEKLTAYPQFLCCYRNCIINMDKVETVEETDFVMENGERVPIAKKQRAELRQHYVNYVFAKMDGAV